MKSLLAGILLLGFVSSANASIYDFSYQFGSGELSGTVDGTLTGGIVVPASITDLYWNGYQAFALDGFNITTIGPDLTDVFIGGSFNTTPTHVWSVIVNKDSAMAWTTDNFTGVTTYEINSSSAQAWSFTEVSVPEASSILLFGFGLLGLFGVARRKV